MSRVGHFPTTLGAVVEILELGGVGRLHAYYPVHNALADMIDILSKPSTRHINGTE